MGRCVFLVSFLISLSRPDPPPGASYETSSAVGCGDSAGCQDTSDLGRRCSQPSASQTPGGKAYAPFDPCPVLSLTLVQALASGFGARCVYPPLALCSDNGAMVAWAALERLTAFGDTFGRDDEQAASALQVRSRWSLDSGQGDLSAVDWSKYK
jgi:hypothetical protein